MAENHESPPDFTVRKKVDESWKDAVEMEKGTGPEASPEEALPGSSFPFFVSTLGMQALAALGEAPDPATGQKHADLPNARYLIDVLRMLAEKTKGNLTPDEDAMMQALLYELQMKFVAKSKI